jgi:alkylation response protein AidB-like acyl-CoA dehydrogenase
MSPIVLLKEHPDWFQDVLFHDLPEYKPDPIENTAKTGSTSTQIIPPPPSRTTKPFVERRKAMSHSREDHIKNAFTALAVTEEHKDSSLSTTDLVISLSDLAAISGLLGRLAASTRKELADWATVGTHLTLAQQYAEQLARCLNHAAGTLAFNTSLQSAT